MTTRKPDIIQDGPDVLVAVRVVSRASRNQLVMGRPHPGEPSVGSITIRLTAPPVEGAANAACRALLADRLGLPRSRVIIVRGEKSRQKLLRIRGADVGRIIAGLQPPK
jgi:uncharacterized protein (TIGR00251 family)